MDVSQIFWQYVDLVATTPMAEVMEHRLYQVFDCADFLNRELRLSQAEFVDVAQVVSWPRGVSFDRFDGVYVFKNYRYMMQGVRSILQDLCAKEDSNAQLCEKLEKLEQAISCIEKHASVQTITPSLFKVAV